MDLLARLEAQIVACERCPRLRSYCAEVAREKRRAYRDWTYWGKPVPGFGDPGAALYVLGLAPAAHGANRTGRVFTGDRSGDFLFAALHRAGFANQAESTSRDDGLRLRRVWVGAAVRCAPPGNKPTREEAAACRDHLARELDALPRVRAVLALGKFGHDEYLRELQRRGVPITLSAYRFAHGAGHELPVGPTLFDTYHPSQQNTFTGRLKPEHLDRIFDRIKRHLQKNRRVPRIPAQVG